MSAQAEIEVSVRLLVAILLGAVIGFEREFTRHPAGLRTMSAVCLGSCLFTVAGTLPLHTDPTRVAAQVTTGIGFIGAGAVLRSGRSVQGLTTAATIWVVAAVGVAAGLGYLILATATAVLLLLSLVGLKVVEDRFLSGIMMEERRTEHS
ncbi:MAG TPA: MgtC/SapB family protein [Candidatus Dormibacteraeota bacterium]